jgi:hypothetical protein
VAWGLARLSTRAVRAEALSAALLAHAMGKQTGPALPVPYGFVACTGCKRTANCFVPITDGRSRCATRIAADIATNNKRRAATLSKRDAADRAPAFVVSTSSSAPSASTSAAARARAPAKRPRQDDEADLESSDSGSEASGAGPPAR